MSILGATWKMALRPEALWVAAAGVAVAGVAVVPRTLHAIAPQPADGAVVPVEQTDGLDEAHLAVHTLLKAAIDACRAVIDVRRTPTGGCELVLWQRDEHDRGRVNEDEVLVLVHSPVLRTLSAFSVPEPESETLPPVIDAGELFGSGLLRRLRDAGASGRVVATDVTDMTIEQRPGGAGEAVLAVRIVWAGLRADEGSSGGVPPPVSSFGVTLPAVQRARRVAE